MGNWENYFGSVCWQNNNNADDDDDDHNNNDNNNNNNIPETRKHWVDVQWGIISSHGDKDPL